MVKSLKSRSLRRGTYINLPSTKYTRYIWYLVEDLYLVTYTIDILGI